MENKRAVFVSTASQVTVRIIGLAISLASVKLLTSAYGLAGTGIYNTITTYLTFSIVIADLGIFSAAVREISKDPAKEREIANNVLGIRLVTAALAAVTAVGIISLTRYPYDLVRGTEIAGAFIFFNLVASSFDIIFQYRLTMQLSALAELASKLVGLLALAVVVNIHAGFLWAVVSIPLSGIVILICKYLLSKRLLPVRPAWNPTLINWILHLSLPLGAVFVISNLYFKVDTLVLFAMKGAAAVGVYSVAYKVLEVTAFIGAYFASSLKPALSKNIESAGQLVSHAIVVMLLASLPIATVSSVFAKPIILFISNSSFLGGVRSLEILAWSLPLLYCDVLLAEVLISRDARRSLLAIALGSLTFNLCLDFLLIPRYSYDGAAVATIISEAVLLIANLFCCQKYLRLSLPWPMIIKIVSSTAITMTVGNLLIRLPIYFLVSIALTLAVYGMSLFVLKAVTREELNNLISKGA